MTVTVVVGGFWGDEGKGKIVSALSMIDNCEVVARGGVGPNAGHTVIHNGETYKLRCVPSGFTNPTTDLLVGPGVLIEPEIMRKEIEITKTQGRSFIDFQTGIIEEDHKKRDLSPHLKEKIGTSGAGTGPANEDRAKRILKVGRDFPELQDLCTDVPQRIDDAIDGGNNVVLEGSQATYLSLFHGTYPFVTSKDVTASAICSDVGIGPTAVDEVVVVFKAFVTRVGEGELPGQLDSEEVQRRGWAEFGTVTGRQRRAAPFNIKLAERAIMLNSATMIAITKLDTLFPEIKGIANENELTKEAIKWIEEKEKALGVPITLIGTGPGSREIIDLR